MKILLTNDDGYNAPGIQVLYNTLKTCHDVTLVAPDREKSGVGHGISLNRPMRIERVGLPDGSRVWAVTGTPADCVKLALFELFTHPPELVIAGINPGSNTGVNINYSGTAAAAREAVLNGIPAIAASIAIGKNRYLDYTGMAQFVLTLAEKMPGMNICRGTFLNLNAPDIFIRDACGIKITRQSSENVSKELCKRADPKKRPYFWYDSVYLPQGETDSDIMALSQKKISITPIRCDATDHAMLDRLRGLEET